jgi:hypothetical protein
MAVLERLSALSKPVASGVRHPSHIGVFVRCPQGEKLDENKARATSDRMVSAA